MVKYSIILPIFKQANHVEQLYKSYVTHLEKRIKNYELMFVVNSRSDESYLKLQRLAQNNRKVKVFQLRQSGWGRAVRFGLKKARGQYRLYTNSARTNLNDLTNILKLSAVNNKFVIKATRITRESFLRRLGSVIYNLECRFLLKTPQWDINGTPKVLPQPALRKLKLTADGDLIDAELMYQCTKLQIPVVEVPVSLTARIEGKSTTNLLSAFHMYLGVFKLRHET